MSYKECDPRVAGAMNSETRGRHENQILFSKQVP